jgi:hypothetical protein
MLKPVMQEIADHLDRLEGIVRKQSWGEIAWFFNPEAKHSNGAYVATIKLRDGPNDRASGLDHDGAHRLNFGMQRADFMQHFGAPPQRPGKGRAIAGPWNARMRGVLQPHPVYGWMCWAAISDPTSDDIVVLKSQLAIAHMRAQQVLERRINRKGQPWPADTRK